MQNKKDFYNCVVHKSGLGDSLGYSKNEYPTVATREHFANWSLKRVDTLINNMRVNMGRNPQFKRMIAELELNSISATTETIVFDGKPKVQTIPQPTNGQVAFIDWVTISFHVSTISPKYIRTNEDDDQYMSLCQAAVTDLNLFMLAIFGEDFSVLNQRQSGMNFYKYSFDIGQGRGFVCIGGQRGTVAIIINGTGCATARRGWEHELYKFLKEKAIRPKITRLDLAHDDINGEYLSVHEMDNLETSGGFHCGGSRPEVQYHGNWKHKDPYNKGLTLAIGNRSSGKYARFYEKGKQLGDKESKWTRAEVEFKSADRVIPFEALIEPSAFFMGAYPCFKSLFKYENSERIKTNIKSSAVSLTHAIDVIKHQFGKYFTFFSKFLDDNEILELVRHKDVDIVPSKLYLAHSVFLQMSYEKNQMEK